MLFSIILIILIIYFVFKSIVIVPQQHVMVVETMGKYSKTLDAGLNILLPFLDKPRCIEVAQKQKKKDGSVCAVTVLSPTIDLREIVCNFDFKKVQTKDYDSVSIKALLGYQIVEPRKAVYSVKNLSEAIENMLKITLMDIVAGKSLQDTLEGTELISEDLLGIMEKEVVQWGVKINRVKLHSVKEQF